MTNREEHSSGTPEEIVEQMNLACRYGSPTNQS